MHKLLFVLGTRPEAIKLCPVLLHMRGRTQNFDVRLCVTAQHRSMLDQVLTAFDVTPDYDLDLMQPAQTLAQSTSLMVAAGHEGGAARYGGGSGRYDHDAMRGAGGIL